MWDSLQKSRKVESRHLLGVIKSVMPKVSIPIRLRKKLIHWYWFSIGTDTLYISTCAINVIWLFWIWKANILISIIIVQFGAKSWYLPAINWQYSHPILQEKTRRFWKQIPVMDSSNREVLFAHAEKTLWYCPVHFVPFGTYEVNSDFEPLPAAICKNTNQFTA